MLVSGCLVVMIVEEQWTLDINCSIEDIDQSKDDFVDCEDVLDVNNSIGLDEDPWVEIEQLNGNDGIVYESDPGKLNEAIMLG